MENETELREGKAKHEGSLQRKPAFMNGQKKKMQNQQQTNHEQPTPINHDVPELPEQVALKSVHVPHQLIN